MIPNDHKIQLGAYRTDRPVEDQEEIEGALKAAAADPQLGMWLEDEVKFDANFRSALERFAAPADLKQSILDAMARETQEDPASDDRGSLVSQTQFRWWRHPFVLSAAASIAVLVAIGLLIFKPQTLEANAELPEFYRHVANHAISENECDLHADELNAIHRFLTENNIPTPDLYPCGTSRLTPQGCHSLQWKGRRFSGICLRANDSGKVLHFYVTERADFPNETHPSSEVLHQSNGSISLAVWSCTNRIYVLVFPGSVDELHQFL